MAIYAVGDVQGCQRSLEGLLARLPRDAARDALWLTGDLVNRGPRSLATLRWAVAQGPGLVTVLGNHDLHLLSRAAGLRRAKGKDTLDEVLAAPEREDLLEWLRGRPLLHREGEWLLVHAGLLPEWSPEQAEELACEVEAELRGGDWRALLLAWAGGDGPRRWKRGLERRERQVLALRAFTVLRTVTPDGALEPAYSGPPAQAPDGQVPWFEAPGRRSAGRVRVVFGHWAALGLHLGEDALGLDTGCVWGGALSAVRLGDRAVWQQPRLD
jgi:bis(5'-nucleosyl)-tetraphosphatase (symmetrical)